MLEFKSKLFPVLFDYFDEQQKLRVLDIGSARGASVAFFGQFRCKLYFADMIGGAKLPVVSDEVTDQELVEQYRQLLDFPAKTQFDLCLFWDFFNLLDRRSMQAFSLALKDFITPQTLAHGFGSLNNKTKVSIDDYSIKDHTTFYVSPKQSSFGRLHHHPQRDFDSLLSGFTINKGTLLQDGKLEVLLQSNLAN